MKYFKYFVWVVVVGMLGFIISVRVYNYFVDEYLYTHDFNQIALYISILLLLLSVTYLVFFFRKHKFYSVLPLMFSVVFYYFSQNIFMYPPEFSYSDEYFTVKTTIKDFNPYLWFTLSYSNRTDYLIGESKSHSLKEIEPLTWLIEYTEGYINYTICFRKFDNEFRAFYEEDTLNYGCIMPDVFYQNTTLDSILFYYFYRNGCKRIPLNIEEIIIDYSKDIKTLEFFDSIKVIPARQLDD